MSGMAIDPEYFRRRRAEVRTGMREVRRRKQFCRHGHELHIAPSGEARCSTCEAERNRRRKAAGYVPPIPKPGPPRKTISGYDGSIVSFDDVPIAREDERQR
jgi:hypothetical protein